jgi:hypothetical protein
MAEPREDGRSRTQIETETARLREAIDDRGELGRDRAWSIEREGLTIGTGPQRLMTGGTEYTYVAPKAHPVWSDALRTESHHLRQIAELGNTLEPWEADDQRWPPAREDGLLGRHPDPMGRAHLPLDQRRQIHDARWQALEAKLDHLRDRMAAHLQTYAPAVQREQHREQDMERDR